MIARHILARRTVTLMIAAVFLAGLSGHGATAREPGRTSAGRPYQIYLLKGLADVFSSGMDFLQAKLEARGVVGEVHSHTEWETLAERIGEAHSAVLGSRLVQTALLASRWLRKVRHPS